MVVQQALAKGYHVSQNFTPLKPPYSRLITDLHAQVATAVLMWNLFNP